MSLVEQALKRAKQSGRPEPLSTATPADTSQEASVAPVPPSMPLLPPEQLIEPSPDITATLGALRHLEIDRDHLRQAGYLPPVSQEREIAEQYRHIKRPLLARALGRGMPRKVDGTVIMVASALQGEGKTFSSINLALSLALESDASVLLIDADTAKAQVSRAFGLEGAPGLVDALMDEQLDAESLVTATDVPKFSILPAGRQSHAASELLGSLRMGHVLERLKSRMANRILVLDSPPLLITNEAKTLIDAAGQAVLVVHAGVTPHAAVQDAISLFREDQYVGLVLNQCDTASGHGYGYGYGYGHYGQGYGQAHDNKRESSGGAS